MVNFEILGSALEFVNECNRQLAALRLALAKAEIDPEAYELLSQSCYDSTKNALKESLCFGQSAITITDHMLDKLMEEQVKFARECLKSPERSR